VGGRWWRVVAVVGLAAGLGELAFAAFLNDGLGSAIFTATVGILFLVGAWLTHGGRVGGVVLVGLLSLLELVFLPAYTWDVSWSTVLQVVYAVLGILGVLGAAVILLRGRRAPRTA
jgi:hypothetical protein